MSETSLDKAFQNFQVAKTIYSTLTEDEAYFNYVGYHLQQSLELALKFILEQNGVEYPKTHDIDQLLFIADKNKVNTYLTEYIEEHSERFTMWESKTRYILDYRLAKKKVETALVEVGKYMDILKKEFQPSKDEDRQELQDKKVPDRRLQRKGR